MVERSGGRGPGAGTGATGGEAIGTVGRTGCKESAAHLHLELKTDRFLEPDVAGELSRSLAQWGVADRTVVISFHLERVLAVKRADPDLPGGFITAKRWTPDVPVELVGPYWPLLIANPFYTWWAHRRGMLVAPLDAAPDRRLWLYRLLGCDAILTDDPGSTRRLLGR